MALKLFETITQLLNGDTNKVTAAASDSRIAEELKHVKSLEAWLDRAEKAQRQYIQGSKEYINATKQMNDANEELRLQELKLAKTVKEVSKAHDVESDALINHIDLIRAHGEAEALRMTNLSHHGKLANDTLEKFGLNLGEIKKFATMAGASLLILEQAVAQIITANNQLVDSYRRTGGVLSATALGFDQGGNNRTGNVGSLNTITATNNINEEQFLSALGGFSSGQVVGMVDNLQKSGEELQKFGVKQGQLIKLYGVSDQAVGTITRTMTQFYGKGIKDLNKEFESGTKIANQAGLNVSEFYGKLSEISNLVGSNYIRNGVEGMKNLALYATKFNLSVSSIVGFGDRYKNFTEIADEQSKAVALGLSNYASKTASMFASYQLGNYEQLSKTMISSLAKDITSKGWVDKNGMIDQQGLRLLSELNIDKDSIQGIQRTIQMQKKLGLSFQEMSNITDQSTKTQMAYYAELNRQSTMQEKLGMLWAQIKKSFIDPVASVLGPAFEVVINVLILAFKALGAVLTPVVWVFQQIGKVLNYVSDGISGFTGWLSHANTAVKAFIAIIGIAGAAMLLNSKQGMISNLLGKIPGGLGSKLVNGLFGTGNVATGAMEGGLFSGGLKGFGGKLLSGGKGLLSGAGNLLKGSSMLKGGLVGLGTNMLLDMVPDTVGGDKKTGKGGWDMSMMKSGAGLGGTIGMFFGPLGALIGTAIGGAVGFVAGNFSKIASGVGKAASAVWASVKKHPWSVLLGPLGIIAATVKDQYDLSKEQSEKSDDFNIKTSTAATTADNIKEIIANRTIANPFQAEKNMERAVNNLANPIIVHVNAGGFPGYVKARIQGQ